MVGAQGEGDWRARRGEGKAMARVGRRNRRERSIVGGWRWGVAVCLR